MSSLKPVRAPKTKPETLVAASIRRDGVVYGKVSKAHWEVRASLGDPNPSQKNPGDEEGFLTSTGRFVSRREAVLVGVASGQLSERWKQAGRELLSSDVW